MTTCVGSSGSPLVGVRGTVVDAPGFGQVRTWPDGAVVFDLTSGRLVEVGNHGSLRQRSRDGAVTWLDFPIASGSRPLILPGLIDVHAHLPQYPASGRGQGELLPWLQRYIFPLERRFDAERSQREAPRFFRELARHGTTSAMLYAAVTEQSCDAAFQAAAASGLRITLGKVMMDVQSYGDLAPESILAISLEESERLCRRWHGAAGGRLSYAFSPRFALSCTREMMRAAADLARRYDAPIQTHLSESRAEIAEVRRLFAEASDYTDVYDRAGLLTHRTVLGHCLHLSDREVQTLARHAAKVAHCPTANFFLSSGLLPLRRLRAAGLTIGLGSDVGAGPELNLWQVMRSAIDTQRALSYLDPSTPPLTPAEAFHLATQGGADALNQGDLLGSLDPGKSADFVVLDPAAVAPYGDTADLDPLDLLTLCVYRGGPQATLATYVCGQPVWTRA